MTATTMPAAVALASRPRIDSRQNESLDLVWKLAAANKHNRRLRRALAAAALLIAAQWVMLAILGAKAV